MYDWSTRGTVQVHFNNAENSTFPLRRFTPAVYFLTCDTFRAYDLRIKSAIWWRLQLENVVLMRGREQMPKIRFKFPGVCYGATRRFDGYGTIVTTTISTNKIQWWYMACDDGGKVIKAGQRSVIPEWIYRKGKLLAYYSSGIGQIQAWNSLGQFQRSLSSFFPITKT